MQNAEVLVAIGARLDEIKIYITKWLSGDPETAVSRIDAINMLDYVKNILHEIKTMYTIKVCILEMLIFIYLFSSQETIYIV